MDYEYLANETTCMDCGVGFWPTKDRLSCFNLAKKHLKHMRWNTWHSILPSILALCGIIATLIVIIIYTM